MNEDTIQELLRSHAEADAVTDEDAAWTCITASIRAEQSRRRRNHLLAAGSAIAATAAAVTLLASFGGEPDQAVDVGPAAPTTAVSSTTVAPAPEQSIPNDSQMGTPIALPDDFIVLASEGGAMVHVLDAVTGERVTTPLVADVGGVTFVEPTISADGTIYTLLISPDLDQPQIIRTRWDAAGDHEGIDIPGFDNPMDGFGSPTISPDGRTLAVSILRGTGDGSALGSLGLLDTATGTFRELTWPEGDRRSLLKGPGEFSFSPDGARLAFINIHDSDGTETFEGYALEVDATSLGEAELVSDDFWDLTFEPSADNPAGALLGLIGPPDDRRPQYFEGGPDVGVPLLEGIRSIESSTGSIIARTEDRWYRVDRANDVWVEVPYGDWVG